MGVIAYFVLLFALLVLARGVRHFQLTLQIYTDMIISTQETFDAQIVAAEAALTGITDAQAAIAQAVVDVAALVAAFVATQTNPVNTTALDTLTANISDQAVALNGLISQVNAVFVPPTPAPVPAPTV